MNKSENVTVKSPYDGKIVEVRVNVNDNVVEGQVILMIESFNIYLKIPSPVYGNITNILVSVGQIVNKNQSLINISSSF